MGSDISEFISLLRSVDNTESIGSSFDLNGVKDMVLSMKRTQILDNYPYQITQSYIHNGER